LHTFVGKKVYLSDPSWVNHRNIFMRAGLDVHFYPYYDQEKHTLAFKQLKQAVVTMPAGSIILLQACGHNPTGADPTHEQWKELSALLKKQRVIPFFDMAYQGFCHHLAEDAFAVRLFAAEGLEMLTAYSFSKNMGLYGERVGGLAFVAQSKETAIRLASQVRQMIRGIYSTPPLHGSRIASTILGNRALRQEWEQELAGMCARLRRLRTLLADSLSHRFGVSYQFLAAQNGMFSFCGLTPQDVQRLIEQYAIYLPNDGRINIAGLNTGNIDYVSNAFFEIKSS
jgi:aspartate/tyrosine/aromatic aminotransferase